MKTPSFFTEKWDTKGVQCLTWATLKILPGMNVKAAETVSKSTARILDQLGVKFWLNTGTALGAVRDKCIMPYDIDVDIMIKAEDCNASAIREAFTNNGFRYTPKLYPSLHKDKLSGIVVSMLGINVDTAC